MRNSKTIAAVAAVATLAVPAAALAKGGDDHGSKGRGAEHSSKAKKPKTANYIFTGLVTAVADGKVSVAVAAGNSRGRRYKGQTLTFDLANSRLRVHDVNHDGSRDLADVAVGDRVLVQAKLSKGVLDVSQALPSRSVLDKGPVKPADDPADDDGDDAAAPETAPAG
jgi:hypothetical protein